MRHASFRKNLQFRLEVFNTFNQPVWQDPNTSVNSAQYGVKFSF